MIISFCFRPEFWYYYCSPEKSTLAKRDCLQCGIWFKTDSVPDEFPNRLASNKHWISSSKNIFGNLHTREAPPRRDAKGRIVSFNFQEDCFKFKSQFVLGEFDLSGNPIFNSKITPATTRTTAPHHKKQFFLFHARKKRITCSSRSFSGIFNLKITTILPKDDKCAQISPTSTYLAYELKRYKNDGRNY